MNPIENVWAVLKANVSNYKPTSTKHLIKIIKNEWKKLDGVFAENLVLSMKNRISLIVNNEGDHILYLLLCILSIIYNFIYIILYISIFNF